MSSDMEISSPSSDRITQSTRVEQARAMADVAAARATAMEYPRTPSLCYDRMRDSCNHLALAERAFFRYGRGGQQVTGPTVHLARELARCWGNITYSVKELYRNDVRLESEMLAYAVDLETSVRAELGFIVPHKRDAGGKVIGITSMRDIYENNANAGARRLRECIFGVLPLRFREDAQALCLKTLEAGVDGVSLQDRKDKAIEAFAGKGVNLPALEHKLGEKEGRWRAIDVAQLGIIWQSLRAGETTVELEFPFIFSRSADIPDGDPLVEPATGGGTDPAETGPAPEITYTDEWPEVIPPGSGQGKAGDDASAE